MDNSYREFASQIMRRALQAPDTTAAASAIVGVALALLEANHGTEKACSIIKAMTDAALKGQQHDKST